MISFSDRQKYEDWISQLTAELTMWRKLAGELRVQESRITGILCDARTVTTDLPKGVAELVEERDRYRQALEAIQQWDCLNPPREDLLSDLGWLRLLVDETLKKV